MSSAKNKTKASKDTDRELNLGSDDDSAAAKGGSKGKSKAGDSTGDIVNVGSDALPNATKAAPAAKVEEIAKGESKKLYLDKVYTFHGRHYQASAHPQDLVTVPKDFPEDILPDKGKAPSIDEWAKSRPPASAVIEVPDESGKQL